MIIGKRLKRLWSLLITEKVFHPAEPFIHALSTTLQAGGSGATGGRSAELCALGRGWSLRHAAALPVGAAWWRA
jgi:hypothetical protein